MSNLVSKPLKQLGQYFLAGVFAILPLVITVLVVVWVAGFLERLVGPDTFLGKLLSNLGVKLVEDSTLAYVVGWGIVLLSILLLGILVQAGLKRLLSRIVDGLLRRLPLVGKVYDASKQLVDMLDKGANDDLKGMSVVFCTFGREGGAGVLALLPFPEPIPIRDREYNVVLVVLPGGSSGVFKADFV
jgi:uncharacterized membrane protein